jgi:PIN domain nuclease of toxin-antitoxin system
MDAVLLDTHAFLWWGAAFALKMPAAFERYITEQMYANGFSEMAIGFRHIAASARLPWHHREPFDRMLIAQAIGEKVAIVSRDTVFAKYGGECIW